MTLPVPHQTPKRHDRPEVRPDVVVVPSEVRVRRDDAVHSVTSAQTPLSEEQRARTRRYLISMSIRTACFLGVVFTEGWIRWALVVGAIFLPYIAVIMANAGRENEPFPGPEAPTFGSPQLDRTRNQLGD